MWVIVRVFRRWVSFVRIEYIVHAVPEGSFIGSFRVFRSCYVKPFIDK